jgi:hypothetical protein
LRLYSSFFAKNTVFRDHLRPSTPQHPQPIIARLIALTTPVEPVPPQPDGLVADLDAALEEEILNIA